MIRFKTFFKLIMEDVQASRRIGIEHISKLKPLEFLALCDHFKNDLKGIISQEKVKINLKIDGCGCLHYDTLIDTLEEGKLKIGDIVREQKNVSVKSFNFNTNKEEYNKVTNWRELDSSDDWYKVTTSSGKTITITGEHPVYLKNLNCWRRVDEVKEGDEVLISTSTI